MKLKDSRWLLRGERAMSGMFPFYSLNLGSFEFLSVVVHSCIILFYYCCSLAQSCLTLGDPMDCSMPGFPVLHYLPEFAQTHVH